MQLGDNALHLAAEGGQLDTMKYLSVPIPVWEKDDITRTSMNRHGLT